jgi:hypothetical protein
MENFDAISRLQNVSAELKRQVYELDKLAKAEKIEPHYVVELGKIAREIYEKSLDINLQ